MSQYGKAPTLLGQFDFTLPEVMYYLYLPVFMDDAPEGKHGYVSGIRLPPNVECCRDLIKFCMTTQSRRYKYAYISARKGWATPDSPLNRPGWHCDGFGTDDLNFLWWRGPGTRFATGDFGEISPDHTRSMEQFERRIKGSELRGYDLIKVVDDNPQTFLYGVDPYVVHATPLLTKGCMRQYVKISLSDHRYDLYNNSHNYLFDYDWPMHDREEVRNDTSKAQRDYS